MTEAALPIAVEADGPLPVALPLWRRWARARLTRLACSVLAVAGAFLFAMGATRLDPTAPPPPIPARMLRALPQPGLPPMSDTGPEIPYDAASNTARKINAQTAFVPGALVLAPPFVFAGNTLDRQRAIDCLAVAAFYEAGTGVSDQRAVMQVVLNRARHPIYPASVCGVVFQGSERNTGCQFTFTCDGAMYRRRPSPLAWAQAQQVATQMLSGSTDPVVGMATHYHTDWVHPAWSAQLDKVAAVRTHLFFRMRGAAGELRSFRASSSGVEPRITRLELLSAAHRPDAPAGVPQLVAAPLEDRETPAPTIARPQPDRILAGAIERIPDRASAPDPDIFLVALDPGASADSFMAMAEARCGRRSHCRFLGWTDAGRKPSQFPIPGASIDAMSFSFIRQGKGEPSRARWNCAQFPRKDESQCLSRGS
ncbi:hypothetical protein FHS96_002733 [Sphingomonas zeicaulis]|uniref:cell wall hydrolase n=1 Tax=Sphingomonas zeicaulis TaxID=1632740 RepID=UPI003D1E9CBE